MDTVTYILAHLHLWGKVGSGLVTFTPALPSTEKPHGSCTDCSSGVWGLNLVWIRSPLGRSPPEGRGHQVK